MATEEEFLKHIGAITNHTMVGHAVVLGKELGLINIMMELTQPQTSNQIASQGNYKAKYVRAWLDLMVCGKLIDYEKSSKTYFIPEHKKAVLKPGGSQNLHFLSTVLSFVSVEPQLKECFKLDGPNGIPMSGYEGFHFHHQSHENSTVSTENLTQAIANIPGLHHNLENGCKILEAGCSTGILCRRMIEIYPESTILGVDISKEGIQSAKEKTPETMKNVTYKVADLSDLPEEWTESYDFVYSHFVIHDVPKASVALKEICRVLKPGGSYLMIDVNMHSDVADNLSHPSAAVAYAASLYFAMPVSLSEEGGEGLGPTWGIENMEEYMKTAGFINVFKPVQPKGRYAFVAGFKSE